MNTIIVGGLLGGIIGIIIIIETILIPFKIDAIIRESKKQNELLIEVIKRLKK